MLREELINLFYQVYDKLSPYGTIAPYSGAINAEKFADAILNLPELKEKLEKADKYDAWVRDVQKTELKIVKEYTDPIVQKWKENSDKWDEIVKYPCIWSRTDDDTDLWETSCGNAFMLNEGTPKNNRMDYCPFCGRKLGLDKERV